MASLRSLGFRALRSAPTADFALSTPWREGVQHKPVGKGRFWNAGGRIRQRRVIEACFGLGVTLVGSTLKTGMAVSEEPSPRAEGQGVTENGPISDLITEFMVKMTCEGCVRAVRSKLEPLKGVKSVDVDLPNQVVRIVGSASIRDLTFAIEQTGRDARLVGQGLPANFAVSAAVAEFKGPVVNGVVRFAQVAMDLTRIDASFSGLTSGSHAWSINMYGDLTQGAASTGGIFQRESSESTSKKHEFRLPPLLITEVVHVISAQYLAPKVKPLGDLGLLDVSSNGDAEYSGTKVGLQVSELIGRSVVLYEGEDKSQNGITAAVIARSAGVGENYKKICSCDGTVIWESTNNDFVKM